MATSGADVKDRECNPTWHVGWLNDDTSAHADGVTQTGLPGRGTVTGGCDRDCAPIV